MNKSFVIAVILLLGLVISISAGKTDYTAANAKVHRMKNDLMNQKKTHPLISDYQMCRKEEGGLESSLNDARRKLEGLKQNLKNSELKVKMQLELIDSLEKQILEAQKAHDKEVAPKIKELQDQLAIIAKIEQLADDLVKKNPKRKPVMDKLKALLDMMKKQFLKMIEDMKVSPVVEKLKHKLEEAKKHLKELQDQVKRDREAIAAMEKTIADLVDELNKKGAECKAVKSKLEEALKKLDKLIALFQKILDILKKLGGAGASGSETEKADKDAVKNLLQSIMDKLKKCLAELTDPEPECKTKEAELRKKIDAKTAESKALEEEIDALKKKITETEAQLAKLLAEASALEGKLNAITAECKKLADAIHRDPILDAELKAIAEILALIHKLESDKELDQESGDKMEAIIVHLRDQIIAAIEKKLKEATEAYNQCKVREKSAHDAWKAKFSESQGAKSSLNQLKSKLANLEQKLGAVRIDRKALLDLLASLLARCANLKAEYAKQRAAFEEEMKILKQAIELLA